VVCLKVLFRHSLGETEENHEPFVRIAGIPAKLRTEYVTNIRLKECHP